MVKCEITDGQLADLKRGIESCTSLGKLNLTGNKITHKSGKLLHDLVQSTRSKRLMYLVLDENLLLDMTMEELASGLAEKYQHMCEERNSTFLCPLDFLSLRRTGITDKGLSALVRVFDDIANKNRSMNEDYDNMLGLDVSYNEIANNGVAMIAQLLPKFNGISLLGLAGLS